MQDTDFRLLMRHIPDEYTTLSAILSKEIAQILVFRAQDMVPALAGSGIGTFCCYFTILWYVV